MKIISSLQWMSHGCWLEWDFFSSTPFCEWWRISCHFMYYSISLSWSLLINGMKNDPLSIKINWNIYNLYFPSIHMEELSPNQLINTIYDCEVCLIITILWTNLKLGRLINPSKSPEAWRHNAKIDWAPTSRPGTLLLAWILINLDGFM